MNQPLIFQFHCPVNFRPSAIFIASTAVMSSVQGNTGICGLRDSSDLDLNRDRVAHPRNVRSLRRRHDGMDEGDQ